MTRPAARSPLADLLGGPWGLFDSGAPPVVFVITYSLAGLRAGVLAALACATGLVGLRLLRRQPVRHALNGVGGVAVSAAVALWLGSARGYFLPGIALSAVYAVVLVGSVVVRRPLVGVVVAALGLAEPARQSPALDRVYRWSTLGWASMFAARAGVQGSLYRYGTTGQLATARVAMGWPLTVLAVVATAAALRRARVVRAGADATRSDAADLAVPDAARAAQPGPQETAADGAGAHSAALRTEAGEASG